MTDSHWINRLRGHIDAVSHDDFPLFFHRVMKTVVPGVTYQHNWHIEAIGEYLAACARGEIRRLIINLPPRMLKSSLISVAWPAWLLGHRPQERIMAASYVQSLSNKHSTDCRLVMESNWYRQLFPETRLRRDQNEKDKFATTSHGYRLGVSVGGAVIGEGGNILIVDDPINPLQASSPTQREGVNRWFEHSFLTRLDNRKRGVVLLVMQRLHPEDLSGYLLKKGGWEQLCLPAIAPVTTRIQIGDFDHRREEGTALHPEREDLALLAATSRELGSHNFNAQYQQAPVAHSGSLLRLHWFTRYEAAPLATSCIQSWDTGIKAGAQHDASACATFIEQDGIHYLIDMLVVRLEYPALKRLIASHAARYHPEAILIEDKGSGQSLLQDLRQESGLPLIACMPKEDKLTRMVRITPLFEAGKMALPHHASWLAAFEAEFFTFPDGAHDDQVDAVSQYFSWQRARATIGQMRVRRL